MSGSAFREIGFERTGPEEGCRLAKFRRKPGGLRAGAVADASAAPHKPGFCTSQNAIGEIAPVISLLRPARVGRHAAVSALFNFQ